MAKRRKQALDEGGLATLRAFAKDARTANETMREFRAWLSDGATLLARVGKLNANAVRAVDKPRLEAALPKLIATVNALIAETQAAAEPPDARKPEEHLDDVWRPALTVEDIADVLGETPAAVKKRRERRR